MEFSTGSQGRDDQIIDLFTATFTASEGKTEGALIGDLVRDLLLGTAEKDLYVFTAGQDGAIIGGVLCSRLSYEQDDRSLFILAPVAVATHQQRRGVGQQLLNRSLGALRDAGVDIAMTYGDPNYYAKVGFLPIGEADAQPPFKLSQPEGWLAQPLNGHRIAPLQGPSRCVDALNDPVFW